MRSKVTLNRGSGRVIHHIAMTDTPNKPGWLIAATFATFVVGFNLLAAREYSAQAHDLIAGVYVLGIGAWFLCAYYFESESVLFRGIIWICRNLSFPAGRKMALFYAALCGVLGAIAVLSGVRVFTSLHHGLTVRLVRQAAQPSLEKWLCLGAV